MFGGDERDALEGIPNDSAARPVGRPPAADRRPHCPGQCQQRANPRPATDGAYAPGGPGRRQVAAGGRVAIGAAGCLVTMGG